MKKQNIKKNAKNQVKTNQECQIVVIVDRSGSMEAIQDDAVGGFNAFIKEQRKIEGKANVTLVLFDDHYEVPYENKKLSKVELLTDKTFIPRGTTALYDAIGKTMAKLEEETVGKKVKEKVIMAILTDGMENASVEYNRKVILKKIKEAEKKGWEFIYLCADEKGLQDGRELFGDNKSHAFVADSAGTSKAFAQLSCSISKYRTGDAIDDD